MRYAEFRYRFEDALQQVGLFIHDVDRVETIDLADTSRRWKVHIIRPAPRSAEPFQVSAEIGFDWTPVDAARAYTCEEDLLIQLIGRRRRPTRTERRWTRVDLSLRANLPYGSTTSMPEPHVFGAWGASIVEKAHATLSEIEEVASEAASGVRSAEEAAIWAMDRMRPALDQDTPAEIRDGLLRLIDLIPPGLHRI